MATKTPFLENKVIDHTVGRTSFTMPTVDIALCTAAPGTGVVANEVASTGYARVATGTGGSSVFAASSAGATSNSGTLTFGSALSGMGGTLTITHAALVDHSSGQVYHAAALTTSQVYNNGDTITASAGAITLSET